MRIWSIHPKYLDTKGLVALWRETLLAKNVLKGNTKGYRNHPQLTRFKLSQDPLNCINYYLSVVYDESINRGYHFSKEKIDWGFNMSKIPVTTGQLEYEKTHLLNKLAIRDNKLYKKLMSVDIIEVHPLFVIIEGNVEFWERQTLLISN